MWTLQCNNAQCTYDAEEDDLCFKIPYTEIVKHEMSQVGAYGNLALFWRRMRVWLAPAWRLNKKRKEVAPIA